MFSIRRLVPRISTPHKLALCLSSGDSVPDPAASCSVYSSIYCFGVTSVGLTNRRLSVVLCKLRKAGFRKAAAKTVTDEIISHLPEIITSKSSHSHNSTGSAFKTSDISNS